MSRIFHQLMKDFFYSYQNHLDYLQLLLQHPGYQDMQVEQNFRVAKLSAFSKIGTAY